MKVYRYRLPITDRPVVDMPDGATVLSLGPPRDDDSDELDLWAMVDPSQPLRPCPFIVVGTGHVVPDDAGAFVDTVATHGGQLIWHVFTKRT